MNVISTFLKSLYKCTHTIISQNSEADMKRWKGKDFKGLKEQQTEQSSPPAANL